MIRVAVVVAVLTLLSLDGIATAGPRKRGQECAKPEDCDVGLTCVHFQCVAPKDVGSRKLRVQADAAMRSMQCNSQLLQGTKGGASRSDAFDKLSSECRAILLSDGSYPP